MQIFVYSHCYAPTVELSRNRNLELLIKLFYIEFHLRVKNRGQICGKTSAVNVPEIVFEMLWIFYYGNHLWMHACVTCGCDKDWVTVCCCVVLDHVYVRWYFGTLWLWYMKKWGNLTYYPSLKLHFLELFYFVL